MMSSKSYKLLMCGLMLVLIAGSFQVQRSLNRDRKDLGLTRITPLENAPPILVFTTVALGGFRGLIANALWIRATDLNDKGKYFEMIQLADWITKLEPTFAPVWVHQAWNLAYNLSIKFRDPAERWHWVKSGIELLRDRGLKYCPNEPLIYRELAWFFQHKIGAYLDDAHMFYKEAWAEEMASVFGPGKPNYEALIDPKTDELKARAQLLRDKYKMDPQFMREVDDAYGPLEWRLPESHAIYWAMRGLKLAKKEDLMVLRRVIYQSMQLAFQRGRLIENPFDHTFEFGPNLDIVEKVNKSYEDMMEQEPQMRDHIKRGHRNFLRDAVYFLYTHNQTSAAAKWFRVIAEKYPDDMLITGEPDTLPGRITLDEYAVRRVSEDVSETSGDRNKAVIEGLMKKSFYNLAIGEDDQAAGYALLVKKVYARYQSEVPEDQKKRIGLPSIELLRQQVLDQILNPPAESAPQVHALIAQLRAKLGLPTATNQPAATLPTP
jgi:hypothetical protein